MKILIVQTGFLGDIILSTPVITGIKEIYPNSEITFLTTPAGRLIIENDPDIENVITFDKRGNEKGIKGIISLAGKLKKMGFQRVYSLHKSYRTSIMLHLSKIPNKTGFKKAKFSFVYNTREIRNIHEHDALRNLAILDSEIDRNLFNQDLRLFPPQENGIKDSLKEISKDKFILMSPGSAWNTKMWHTRGYNETARYFEKKGYKILISGSGDEVDICNYAADKTKAHNLAGKISLMELKYLISRASLVICNDSMCLHMASALKTPTIAVFCSTIPEFGYGPWKNKSIIVEKKLRCRPCGRHGHEKCPIKTEECMKIPSIEVINACERLLGEE